MNKKLSPDYYEKSNNEQSNRCCQHWECCCRKCNRCCKEYCENCLQASENDNDSSCSCRY
ncbi:MAG: hypothetical protein E7476_06480 [Ruminococcaceae bacterium]|nr:hypothetical protein [Oscillospiraceae bacterium]